MLPGIKLQKEPAMKTALFATAALFLALPAFAGNCPSKTTTAQYTHGELTKGEYSKSKAATVDIVATAQAAGSFNTLLAAAEAAGLVEALQGEGPLTVFAPTDAAFAALPAGTVETLLLPENKDQLAAILKLHVIAGQKVKSTDLAGKTITAETLNGQISIDGTDGVMVNDANVIQADVKASNGIIHVIDKVLLPSS
jgi:uncharacterized surface protein with fasciclin (FAS1) repeats